MSNPRDGLERVRDALHGHGIPMESKADGSWRARCPLHGGTSKTSMSLRHVEAKTADGHGRAQLRCFGGCDEREILAHVGLALGDLYDAPPPRVKGTVVREHPYIGAAGQMLGVVRRTEDKVFLPATPTQKGWVTKSNDDLKTTPYRLVAVLTAIEKGNPVYVVEGERDADALAAAGIAATCNAGGAGKWTAAHARWLTGATVTVCRDRDEPGHRHAAQVAASLVGTAAAVRIVEPVEGKDVADHLAAGHGLDELVPVEIGDAAPQAAEPRTLRVTKASQVKPRRLPWLWDRRIVLGGLTLLAGREGLGKSTIATDLTAQVTRGVLDGEHKGEPRTVVYVNSEDARDYTIVPRLLAAGADMDRVLFVDAVTRDPEGDHESPLVLPLDVARLAAIVLENAAALVVLDAATSVIDSRLDGDRDRQMRIGLEGIARGIGEATGCAVLGLVHFSKRDSSDTGKLILGSIAWSQVARSVLAVARDEDNDTVVVSTSKANLGPGAPSLSARIVSFDVRTDEGITSVGRIEWLGETDRDARDLLGGGGEVDERSDLDEARDWLTHQLGAKGWALAGALIKAGKRDGIAERTLQRARKKEGIATQKVRAGWIWALPGKAPADGEMEMDEDEGGKVANLGNAVTSQDAKAPTNMHVQEPWRLGALAPSTPSVGLGGYPLCSTCGDREVYRSGASVCGACDPTGAAKSA